MEKVFKNKKLAYVLIGILCALQLTQSIANWCGGGFNGGSLILCILMLGLLTLVGVGIAKNNKLLTIISGVSILSVLIYILAAEYSGIIQKVIEGKVPNIGLVRNIFGSIATLLLIGCFILVILRAFEITKNLKTINSVFSIIAVILFLTVIVTELSSGYIARAPFTVYEKIYRIVRDIFALFIALLIPCVWHQVDNKE